MADEKVEHITKYDAQKKAATEDAFNYGKALMNGTLTLKEFARIQAEREMALKAELATAKHEAKQYKVESAFDSLLDKTLNRRRFEEAVDRSLEHANRNDEPYSFVFIDVDLMKELNDKLGHQRTDQFLKALQEAALGNIRKADVFGRWGGDELALGLPGATVVGALRVAENISLAYAHFQREWGLVSVPESNTDYVPDVVEEDGDRKFNHQRTLSFGIAQRAHNDWAKRADLELRADAAMYVAKESGKQLREEHPTPNYSSTFAIYRGTDDEGKPIIDLVDPAKSHLYQEST